MIYTDEEVARVCHAANRELQTLHLIRGEQEVVSKNWDDESYDMQQSAVKGVVEARNGATPEELHASWCDTRREQGWIYGPVKDEDAKTHPCLVPYDELPEEQRQKDYLFAAIVNSLTSNHEGVGA